MTIEVLTMRVVRPLLIGAALVALAASAFGQGPGQRPARVISPEVGDDGNVTFRLRGPEATEVVLDAELAGGEHPMTKGDDGIWTVTIGPLDPEIYEYTYRIDGVKVTDPHNAAVKIWMGGNASVFEVMGDGPAFYDRQAVPHGDVHIHRYDSKSIGQPRRMHVYTPPGYENDTEQRYPVLYLLHGSGDDDSTWVQGGRADIILDNLIAEGKAEPMIVVMTNGHPTPWGTRRGGNTGLFDKDIVGDVIPFIDSRYRTKSDQRYRAIVGLSMGGGQSLSVGMNNLDLFDYVGSFSGAIFGMESNEAMQSFLKNPEHSNSSLRLLWIGCGEDDFLLSRNESLNASLKEAGIEHVYRITPGGHAWPVWRGYLREIAPLLFAE